MPEKDWVWEHFYEDAGKGSIERKNHCERREGCIEVYIWKHEYFYIRRETYPQASNAWGRL